MEGSNMNFSERCNEEYTHIIGVFNDIEGRTGIHFVYISDEDSLKKDPEVLKFDYCPRCGQKLIGG